MTVIGAQAEQSNFTPVVKVMNHMLITTVCTHITAIFWHYEITTILITVGLKNYIRKMSHTFGSLGKQNTKEFLSQEFPNKQGKKDPKRKNIRDTCKLQQS